MSEGPKGERIERRAWLALGCAGVVLAGLALVLVPPKVTADDVDLSPAYSGIDIIGGAIVRISSASESALRLAPLRPDDVAVDVEGAGRGLVHRSDAAATKVRASIRAIAHRVEPTPNEHLPDVPGRRFMVECRCTGELDGVAVEPFELGPFYFEVRELARPVLPAIVEDAMLGAVGEELAREVRWWCVEWLDNRQQRETRFQQQEELLERVRTLLDARELDGCSRSRQARNALCSRYLPQLAPA
jgi:hypothetical protein